MRISLCMIVKNEEENIKECLDKAIEVVDEVIVVDTGSTDDTISIVKKYGDKVNLVEYIWNNDFAEARNKSLEYAKGDYILILDADERVFSDKVVLKKYLEEKDELAYSIPIYNVYEGNNIVRTNMMIRLYKNLNPRYEGAIHEQLHVDGKKILGSQIPSEVCKIYHFGYASQVFEKKNKSKRNMDIIQEELKKNPKDPFNWYNKGVMEMIAGNLALAFHDFLKAHKLTKNTRMAYHNDMLIRMMQILFMQKKYNKAIEFIKPLTKDVFLKNIPDIYYYLGLSYKEINKHNEAIKALNRAVIIGDIENANSKLGMGSYLSLIEWAKVLEKDEKIEEAIIKYREAVSHPNNYKKEGIQELKQLLTKYNLKESQADSLTLTKDNEEVVTLKDNFIKNVNILIESLMLDEANILLEEYKNIVGEDEEYFSSKGIIAIMIDDYELAEFILMTGLDKFPYNLDILYNLVYMYEKMEKLFEAYKYLLKIDVQKLGDDEEVRKKIILYGQNQDVSMKLDEISKNIELFKNIDIQQLDSNSRAQKINDINMYLDYYPTDMELLMTKSDIMVSKN